MNTDFILCFLEFGYHNRFVGLGCFCLAENPLRNGKVPTGWRTAVAALNSHFRMEQRGTSQWEIMNKTAN